LDVVPIPAELIGHCHTGLLFVLSSDESIPSARRLSFGPGSKRQRFVIGTFPNKARIAVVQDEPLSSGEESLVTIAARFEIVSVVQGSEAGADCVLFLYAFYHG